jgi:hypothetical protein
LQAFSVIVLWERGGEGWLSGVDRLDLLRLGRSDPLGIAGWAFDSMTGKGGGNKFFQTFHRGLLKVRRELSWSGKSSSRENSHLSGRIYR